MANLKLRELREMGAEERKAKMVELREELSKDRGHIASGTRPENTGKMRAVRKTIARILTIENEAKTKQQEVPKKK